MSALGLQRWRLFTQSTNIYIIKFSFPPTGPNKSQDQIVHISLAGIIFCRKLMDHNELTHHYLFCINNDHISITSYSRAAQRVQTTVNYLASEFDKETIICLLAKVTSGQQRLDAVIRIHAPNKLLNYMLYCYGLTRSGRLERLAGQETRPDRRRTGRLRLVLFFFDSSNPRT